MSTDLTVQKPQELIGGNPSQVRLSIEECWRIAQFLSASKMFQNKGSNMSNEECMAVVMMGQGLGIPPAVAMLNIHMIEGRPSMAAELLGYFIKSSGKYDYRSVHARDDEGNYVSCTVTVYDTESGEAIGDSTFTMGDAKRANLIKDRGNWQKHPGAMLHARAVSQALRWHAPDAIPIRPYALDEIEGTPSGVVTVEGEPQVSPAEVEAVVEAAMQAAEETEEVEVSTEDVTDPAIQETAGASEEEVQDAEVTTTEEAAAAPAPFDIEGVLREDLKSLGLLDKQFIKQQIAEKGWPFSHASIVRLMATRDAARIGDYLARVKPAAGVTSRSTGSQTEPVISDAQLGMLHARMSALNFTEQEKRTYYKRYAQVESGRDIKKRDFDEMLVVLRDIEDGDDATRRAYIGGVE